MNDMASATKKPKLDSNGAAHKEIAGVYDKYVCTTWGHLFIVFVCACSRVKYTPFLWNVISTKISC